MPCNVAIYARSSPDCPVSAEEQTDRLRTVAGERGWTVAACFKDAPSTAKKGKGRRPGEIALLDTIRRGFVQKVLLLDLDRCGKSLADLTGFLEICREANVSLWIEARQFDTETSNGMSLFDLARMMAHHLRQSRRERILMGLSAARANAIKLGRPSLPASKIERAREGLIAGKPVRQVARTSGISVASVSRLKATIEQGPS
jgi:DNA invertase Pin-like site-specific DNA recombinase